jgi:hypothetical protein
VQNGVTVDHGTNGYSTGSTRLNPTNISDVVSGTTYLAGPLGTYYQATNSSFINKGSLTDAAVAGLFHYSLVTNLVGGIQIKETNSVVDIGFHYVATDAIGQALDTDGDGLPDYLEDVNGNGNEADDATGWQAYNSANGLVAGSGLQVFTPLK